MTSPRNKQEYVKHSLYSTSDWVLSANHWHGKKRKKCLYFGKKET